MKNIIYYLFLASACCAGQKDGTILSITPVDFPKYEEAPAIEMYYDQTTYNSAISDQDIRIEKIIYYSDGLRVVAYLSRPVNIADEFRPVIIFNRGSGVRNDISYVHAPLFKKLVKAGFIVVAPALRGSEGGEGKDEIGGRDINDIINILPVLQQLPYADTQNLFMLGESRGGIMTYLAMKRKFPIKAAAVVGGITDFDLYFRAHSWAENAFKETFPSYTDYRDSILRERSALYWADEINTPILIMNGEADPQVFPAHALQLASKLSEFDKEYQLVILEGGNHILSGQHTNRRDNEVIEWFRKYIKQERI